MADYIRPTPRNPILGLLADALTGGVDWMRDPRRAQQMQGLGGLLAETGIPATMERLSYGEPLTKGRGMTTRLRPEAEAALMTLGPEAVPIGRAAMAGVRATKGLPVGAATVYHGSPHKFDRFDASKIGTGEGAQAYGHGLYFAESPGVAEDYAKTLASPRNRVMENRGVYIEPSPAGDGKWRLAKTSEVGKQIGRTGDATQGITDWRFPNVAAALRYAKKNGLIAKDQRPILTEIAEEGKYRPVRSASEMEDPLYNQLIASDPGYRYTVDLPDEKIARMLDWDKPLSQQPEVIKALKGTDYEVGMSQREAEKVADMRLRQEADEWAEMTGGDPVDYSNNVDWEKYVDQVRKESGSIDSSITGKELHRMVMRDEGYRPELFDPENYQIGTSEALRGYGIPGIRYLDASSRDAGQGTSNFVVFPGEEELLRILNVEGGLLAP